MNVLINIFILFVNLCIIISCTEENKEKEEKDRELIKKNKIFRVKEFVTINHIGIAEKEYVSRIKTFNNRGDVIHEKTLSDKNEVLSITIFEYDKNDNLILKTGLDKDSSFVFKESRTFNEKNKIKELSFFLPDGTYKYRNITTYDNEDRIIELDWYWPTGLKAKNIYSYNGFNMIENVEYDLEGNFQYKWIYKYNEKDYLIQSVQYYPNNVINAKVEYNYDINGQLIKQINYLGEIVQKVITYEYNKNQILTSKIEFSSTGRIIAKYRYQYETY